MLKYDPIEIHVREAIDQLMLDAVKPGIVVVGLVYLLLAPACASYPPPSMPHG